MHGARGLGPAALVLASLCIAPAQAADLSAPDWQSIIADLPTEGFSRPSGPWGLDLPGDHAPHPEARTEVWQLAAHLRDAAGAPVGVQFLVFRLGLRPADAPNDGPWVPRSLFRAHFIVLEGPGSPAQGVELFRRALPGLVGWSQDEQAMRLDDWALAFAPDGGPWHLEASIADTHIALELIPTQQPLPLEAAEAPFRGYAQNRLDVSGTLTSADGAREVVGSASFEQLWGELPVPGSGAVVSDRLQLQLEDGTDLTLIRSRRADGRGTPSVDAFVVDATGRPAEPEAEVTVAGTWQGVTATWPLEWDIRVGDLVLSVRPVAADQEFDFAAPVWSGLVHAEGARSGQPVQGLGTLQLSAEGL